MPQDCTDYGQGWSGDFPNCVYETPEFTGTTGSEGGLGFQDILPADIKGTPWSDFFDDYDPTREQMATTGAGIDIGQLQDVWSLQSDQLGEAWGLKRGELRERADASRRKSNLAYSGTVETGFQKGVEAGKTAYEQALATGELGLTQGITDIYQQLGQDIYGYQQDWEKEQRSTLNVILGMEIWGDEEEEQTTFTCEQQNMQTCPDGSCAPWDGFCGTGAGDCEPPAGGCADGEVWNQNTCTCVWAP